MNREATASDQSVLLESLEAGVLTLTLNRPERYNALNAPLQEALALAIGRAAADDGCRVVMLTGAGKGFCAGADLADRSITPGAHVSPVDAHEGSSGSASVRPLHVCRSGELITWRLRPPLPVE